VKRHKPRIQVGDLVKDPKFSPVFLVIDIEAPGETWANDWLRFAGGIGWHAAVDFEVISESR
jgi:hypothetical protein